MRSLLSLTLSFGLVVALVGCDATDTSSAVAIAASDNAATVGCDDTEYSNSGTLVDLGGFFGVVVGELTRAGCVLNNNTGVLQYSILLPEEYTPTNAQVIEDTGITCVYAVDGAVIEITDDVRVVNTPSGLSHVRCRFVR